MFKQIRQILRRLPFASKAKLWISFACLTCLTGLFVTKTIISFSITGENLFATLGSAGEPGVIRHLKFNEYINPSSSVIRVLLTVSIVALYILYIYRRVSTLKLSRVFVFLLLAVAPAFIGAEITYIQYLAAIFCNTDPLFLNLTTQQLICSYDYGPMYFLLTTVVVPFYFLMLGASWVVIERGIIPFIAPEFSLWAIHNRSFDIREADEGSYLEFKASFDTPLGGMPGAEVRDGQSIFMIGNQSFKSKSEVTRFIQTQCLKCVVAFLNTSGGLLVIGVAEQKRVKKFIGLAAEENWSDTDSYGRHIQQQIINRIGKKFASEYIRIRFEVVENQEITIIEVKEFRPRKGVIPAMLDGKAIYIRIDARSEKVDEGESAARFIAERAI